MIQELYFAPHSTSRSQNQMNTSVTLRYDTKTEKLQLVDVFGKVKNITIDTDPDDLTKDDLLSTITTDFIKDLGFETATETEAKATTVDTGYGLGVSVTDTNYKVYLKKSVITGIINEQVTPTKVRSWFSAQSGITYSDGTFELDGPFIDQRLNDFMADRGYVTIDNDTIYHADEETLTLHVTPVEPTPEDPNPSGVTNTFSINTEWLSGFVSGFLGEADIIPLSAGEGVSIENIEVEGHETNVISLTSHIPTGLCDVWEAEQNITDISGLGFIQIGDVPVYTAGDGIAISDEKEISLTAHIPSGIRDIWADGQNITDIYSLGFALRTELVDTLYYADNISLTLAEGNIFSINQSWLSTFVQSFGFLTEDSDTTYTGSESIDVSSGNVISVNQTWLGQAVAPIVVSNIATPAGAVEVKKIVTSGYIAGLGFRLAAEDKDTTYSASENGGLTLTSTSFAVDTDWLNNQISEYIDTKVTSTWVSSIGVKITDTIVSEGLGIDVEYDVNNPQVQLVSVDPTWISGRIAAYNDENGINPSPALIAGTGIKFVDVENTRTISVSAHIPTTVAELDDEANYAKKTDLNDYVTSTQMDTKLNDYLKIADYVDNNTEYVAGSGLALDDDTKTFSLTAQIPSIEGLATEQFVGNQIAAAKIAVTGYTEETYAKINAVPTGLASWTSGANQQYISSLGFVLAGDDKDTKYGVVSNGGLNLDTEHNFSIDTTWMENTLAPYAQTSAIPTKVSELTNDKSFVTAADLEAVRLSLLQQFANLTLVVDIDGDVNTPEQNIYVETSEPISSNTTFTGKNITVTKLNNNDSYVKFNSTGDISISKLNSSGNLDKATNGNAQVIINTPERVSITDSTLAQTGYNAIEIGLDASVEPPKSVLIDGVHFNGALTNNAISIFGTADDAVVTISNCDFSQVSNALRISNRTNTKVTINLINCTFGTWESGEYAGAIICQDYTSTTAEETISANRFAPNKVIINMIGCSHNGTPITFSDPSTVIGTGNENQLLYVYLNKGGGLLAYTPDTVNRFPSFSAK